MGQWESIKWPARVQQADVQWLTLKVRRADRACCWLTCQCGAAAAEIAGRCSAAPKRSACLLLSRSVCLGRQVPVDRVGTSPAGVSGALAANADATCRCNGQCLLELHQFLQLHQLGNRLSVVQQVLGPARGVDHSRVVWIDANRMVKRCEHIFVMNRSGCGGCCGAVC